jgi:hypothetical protein
MLPIEDQDVPAVEEPKTKKSKKSASLAVQGQSAASEPGIASADQPPVTMDATGLALEAISRRAAHARQATVGGERAASRQPVALPAEAPKLGVKEWAAATDATSGQVYYFNVATGVTQWTAPEGMAVAQASAPVPADGWASIVDAASGKTYLHNV